MLCRTIVLDYLELSAKLAGELSIDPRFALRLMANMTSLSQTAI